MVLFFPSCRYRLPSGNISLHPEEILWKWLWLGLLETKKSLNFYIWKYLCFAYFWRNFFYCIRNSKLKGFCYQQFKNFIPLYSMLHGFWCEINGKLIIVSIYIRYVFSSGCYLDFSFQEFDYNALLCCFLLILMKLPIFSCTLSTFSTRSFNILSQYFQIRLIIPSCGQPLVYVDCLIFLP